MFSLLPCDHKHTPFFKSLFSRYRSPILSSSLLLFIFSVSLSMLISFYLTRSLNLSISQFLYLSSFPLSLSCFGNKYLYVTEGKTDFLFSMLVKAAGPEWKKKYWLFLKNRRPSPPPFTSLLGQNIRLRIMFSSIINLRSTIVVRSACGILLQIPVKVRYGFSPFWVDMLLHCSLLFMLKCASYCSRSRKIVSNI